MRARSLTFIAALITVLVLIEILGGIAIESKNYFIDISFSHGLTLDLQRKEDENIEESSASTSAKFHGLGLKFISHGQTSMVHCVGDNFLPKTSAGYRSCEFRHLCWDLEEKEFVIFESEQHQRLSGLLQQMPSRYARISSSFDTAVSISPTTESRLRQGNFGQWFPRRVPEDIHGGYYELPEDVVWLPIEFPTNGSAAKTEIVLDYFHPVFSLLQMFYLQNKTVLFMNLSPGCQIGQECYSEALHFLPMMKHPSTMPDAFVTPESTIQWSSNVNEGHRSNLVCAKYGAGGIGGLNDHGIHKWSHGERRKDYTFVQNSGRGPIFFDFRNYVLKNLGIVERPVAPNNNAPMKAIVSTSSSRMSGMQHFEDQISAIQQHFPAKDLVVQEFTIEKKTFREELKIVSGSNFYISVMGDGALPAFFLPRGATLILFYNDMDELVSVRKREVSFPAKIDWDLWNNLSHLRVHWLPLSTMKTQKDINILLQLIQTDIDDSVEQGVAPSPRNKEADGSFNGIDVFYTAHAQASRSHCVGDNFLTGGHALRSCEFRNICLDLGSSFNRFSLAASNNQSLLMDKMAEWNHFSALASTTMNSNVSVGHNIRFQEKSEWFPRVLRHPVTEFYELPDDIVWIPFFADEPNIHNPGHLLWDFFLPFYNLLTMFGLERSRLLITNIDNGCTQMEESPCWKMVTKFLPLLGVEPSTFRNTYISNLETKGERRSNIVCARYGTAGIGMLTDHGYNRHGQRFEDYRDVHNVGRGPLFHAFRNYALQNLGIRDANQMKSPHVVTFSINSSKNPARRLNFHLQASALSKSFPKESLAVKQTVLADLSVPEQVKTATETAVFVSVVGGAASTAMFLPRGSSVILFFNDIDDFVDHSPRKDFPCMIDWDFWNNASYLRVHWLPMRTMDEPHDLMFFTELVKSEINTLRTMRKQ